MLTALIILAVGFLLLFIEFFLPGGIMGIAGAIVVITAMVLFVMQSESLLASIAFVAGTTVALVFLIRYALWKVQNTKGDFSVYSDGSQEGYYASSKLDDAIGKTCVALTDLRPGGYIQLDGKRVQAISKSGYISKGSQVEIIAAQEESLIVKIKG